MTTYNDLMEGTDKAAFLRWLHAEMGIFGEQMAPTERDAEINRICQRWIKYKIRESAEMAKAGVAL